MDFIDYMGKQLFAGLKNWVKLSVALFGISLITRMFPGIVSVPFKEYAEKNSIPTKLTADFDTDNMRVYRRGNPLSHIDAIGRGTFSLCYEALQGKVNPVEAVGTILSTPVQIMEGVVGFANPISAFHPDDHLSKTQMIYPPSYKVTVADLVNVFSTFNLPEEDTTYSTPDFSQAAKEYILLHEMRHTDQKKYIICYRESDSDVYSLRTMGESRDTSVTHKMAELILHARVIAATRGDFDHATSFCLEAMDATPVRAAECSIAFMKLSYIFNATADMESKTSEIDQRQAIATTLLKKDLLDEDIALKCAAVQYIEACDYFNALTHKNPDKTFQVQLPRLKEAVLKIQSLE